MSIWELLLSTLTKCLNIAHSVTRHALSVFLGYGDSEALRLDHDGAWVGGSAGIIKPAVTFGENVKYVTRSMTLWKEVINFWSSER